MQTVGKIISINTKVLTNHNIENAKDNVLHIVAHVLGCKTNDLFLMQNKVVTKKQFKQINKMVGKRKKGVPFQHIVGFVWFLDLILKVNKNVLIPRNETEILAELLINHINAKTKSEDTKNLNSESKNINSLKTDKNNTKHKLKVLDLCCGSGAIGLSVAKGTSASVVLSDISSKAIKVAKQNAKANNILASFVKSDLFKNVTGKFNLIVSNPPYIKSEDIKGLQTEVKNFEPHLALDGGESGYDFYEKIIKSAPNYLESGGELFLEIGVSQSVKIENMLKQNGFENINKIRDYSNKIRFISANLKGELW